MDVFIYTRKHTPPLPTHIYHIKQIMLPFVGVSCEGVCGCLPGIDTGVDTVGEATTGLLSATFSLVFCFFGESSVRSIVASRLSDGVFSFRPMFASKKEKKGN